MTKNLGCLDSNSFLFPLSILILHNCICQGFENDAQGLAHCLDKHFELKDIGRLQR